MPARCSSVTASVTSAVASSAVSTVSPRPPSWNSLTCTTRTAAPGPASAMAKLSATCPESEPSRPSRIRLSMAPAS